MAKSIADLAENGNFEDFEKSISKRQMPLFDNNIIMLQGFRKNYPDSSDRH